MPLPSLAQVPFPQHHFHSKSRAIQRSLSGRSLCSVRLFQSVVGRKSLVPPFHSPLVSIASASPEKGQAATTLPRPHLLTLSSCVRRGYYIHNTASFHFSPQAPLHYIQQYYVCHPWLFQRLLLRTAIGVCSVITLHLNKERPEKGANF